MSRVGRWAGQAQAFLGTLRVRLTLWYVVLLALILTAFSAFLYISLYRSLHAEVDRSLAAEAQRLISALDVVNGQPGFSEGLNNLQTGTVAALYDRTGRQLLANDPHQPLPAEGLAIAAQGQETLITIRLSGGATWRMLIIPVVQNGEPVAILQVARPERDVEVALGQLVLLMALAVPVTLLVAVLGGVFLAERALNPVDRITRTAAQIGAEDLSQRLNLKADDEVGRLARTFDGMLDRLQAAFKRQRQFTADASHELRTPLALLRGQIDLALERRRPAAEYARILASLREDTERMGRLLGELLTLARADAGQEVLARERVDLNELADQVVQAVQPLTRERGVVLRREGGDGTAVEGDQTRLMQLLLNLVDNALKYTPGGGTVTVTVGRDADWAVLRVADTGDGIASEHLPHLFERFYRVDKARSRNEGGVGLGLAICRWIAEAHGGTIGVESQPGRGTTFTIHLPLAGRRGDAGAANERAPDAAVEPPGATRSNRSASL